MVGWSAGTLIVLAKSITWKKHELKETSKSRFRGIGLPNRRRIIQPDPEAYNVQDVALYCKKLYAAWATSRQDRLESLVRAMLWEEEEYGNQAPRSSMPRFPN